MDAILQFEQAGKEVDQDVMLHLRQALLFLDWRKKRPIAMRRFQRFTKSSNRTVRSIALAGLATGHYWNGELQEATKISRVLLHEDPCSSPALWCASLLVVIFHRLGMAKEHFEAERERIRLLRRLAFNAQQEEGRVYALQELKRELESRNLFAETHRFDKELADLLSTV